ncbi:glycoside hydrolase family 95-like protein [Streptomyces sp. uw30]|uniref:glycoside hydrolase family 95-like protein n=1 Tax=Streptomyces sp. uw30 TaxID=1828179 RepID=UPI003966DDCB
MLVQSTPGRLVLLPALPPFLPAGRLAGVRTRFGAEVELTWAPGRARAVVKPTRTVRIEVRTSSGDGDGDGDGDGKAQPLDLTAGEDHVLSLGAW